jgi:hypothetical protein
MILDKINPSIKLTNGAFMNGEKSFRGWELFTIKMLYHLKSDFLRELKTHSKFQYTRTSPSDQKVCVVGGWWWFLKINLVLALVQTIHDFELAKLNNTLAVP